jgi:PAS domain S-box-containing protein
MAITSPQTKHWVRFNDRLCEILGYSPEELGEMSWADMTHPEDLAKDVAEFERVMRGESEGYAMEKRFLRKDGVVVHGAIDVKCSRNPNGTVDFFVATVQDITERKVSEARILRLSRLYATLSRCNEAIVRCADQEALFAEVCRAAVESGGLRIATVGLVDDAGTFRPVASAGGQAGYVEGIRISVDATDPHGRGPTGTAIREGRPVWCQEFMNDPATVPWRERGERYGWRSSAALPLRRAGVPIGALTLYSTQPGVFDEETQKLLVDMAGDVSFALDNFERDARRRVAELAVRDSEERYRLLFESSLDAILLTDVDGPVLAANPAACRMLGRTEAQIVQAGRAGLVDTADPRLAAALEERRRTGEFRGELTMLRADGERFPVEISTSVFEHHDGRTRSTMVIRDISERKHSESLLLEQLGELRRWHQAMLGREERVLELKAEVNELLKSSALPPRYPSAEPGPAGTHPA